MISGLAPELLWPRHAFVPGMSAASTIHLTHSAPTRGAPRFLDGTEVGRDSYLKPPNNASLVLAG